MAVVMPVKRKLMLCDIDREQIYDKQTGETIADVDFEEVLKEVIGG